MQDKKSYRGVNKDLWAMTLEFSQEFDSESLDKYETDGVSLTPLRSVPEAIAYASPITRLGPRSWTTSLATGVSKDSNGILSTYRLHFAILSWFATRNDYL